jgi:hypothetical protein
LKEPIAVYKNNTFSWEGKRDLTAYIKNFEIPFLEVT